MAEQPERPSTFDAVIGGETATFYEHERPNVNQRLVKVAQDSVADVTEGASKLHAQVLALCPGDDTLRAAPVGVQDFLREYAAPVIAPVDTETLVASHQLKIPAAEVQHRGGDPKGHTRLGEDAKEALRDLSKEVALEREVTAFGATVAKATECFFDDAALPEQVGLPLHRAAFANDFAFARAELAKETKNAAAIEQELATVEDARSDAEHIGDANAARELHYRELELREALLKIARARVDAAAYTAVDAQDFAANAEALRDEAAAREAKYGQTHADVTDRLAADMERTATLLSDETTRNKDLADEETAAMKQIDARIDAAVKERLSVWENIRKLLQRDAALVAEAAEARTALVAHVQRSEQRKAEFNSFTSGLVAHSNLLDGVSGHLDAAQRLRDELAAYHSTMSGVLDAKGLAEESRAMRHKEQLAYLESYTAYRLTGHELVHRKETRIVATRRLVRNLELQIREAQHLLDPNRAKYEKERDEASSLAATLAADVKALDDRIEREQRLWQPVEEQLEDDGVDFEPPAIVSEKHNVERKAQSLAVARDYVVAEQEHVDRDALSLRKVKTAQKINHEDFEHRRAAKVGVAPDAVEGSQSTDASAAPPPPPADAEPAPPGAA